MFAELTVIVSLIMYTIFVRYGESTNGIFSGQDNYRFPMISSTSIALSKIDCCFRCLETSGCKAVNVNLGNLPCELVMDVSYYGNVVATNVQGWKFYVLGNPATCLPGWRYLNGSCYYPQTNEMTWDNALAECEHLNPNSTLTDVTSSSEQLFLEDLIAKEFPTADFVWIGGRIDDSGAFVWRNLNAMDTGYINWKIGQPDGADQDCVCIVVPDNNTWHDNNCSSVDHSICRYNLN